MLYFTPKFLSWAETFFFFCGSFNIRFTSEAVEALQVASEAMLVQVFEDSVLIMVHSKRVTLMEKDIKLVRRIRGV